MDGEPLTKEVTHSTGSTCGWGLSRDRTGGLFVGGQTSPGLLCQIGSPQNSCSLSPCGPSSLLAMGLRMSEWLSPQQERRQKVLAP